MQPPSSADSAAASKITLADFQRLIRDMYFEKDLARGIDGTFMWLMEEVGELAAALRGGTHEERLGEFADVLAWLATIANVAGVDLAAGDRPQIRLGLPGLRPIGLRLCRCGEAMSQAARLSRRQRAVCWLSAVAWLTVALAGVSHAGELATNRSRRPACRRSPACRSALPAGTSWAIGRRST